jgi:hypothetical protein
MSLNKAIAHNQSLFIAAIISILCFGGIAACHLTQAQKKQIITTAIPVAEAVLEGSPLPWSEIGLAIGAILGSGAVVDNRRKDVLIKRLKTENDNITKITGAILDTKFPDPKPPRPTTNNNTSRVPPLCNN